MIKDRGKHRFTEVSVWPECNVSSSGDYFVRVRYRDIYRFVVRDFWLQGGFLSLAKYNAGDWQAPQYLVREAKRIIADLMLSGKMQYFEYDRQGNKRYQELRYHNTEYAHLLAKQLVKEVQFKTEKGS